MKSIRHIDQVAVRGGEHVTVLRAGISATANGDNTVIAAPGAGLKLMILALRFYTVTTSGTCAFKSGSTTLWEWRAGNGVTGKFLGTLGGAVVCGTNEAFIVNNATNVDHYGLVAYCVVAA